MSQKLSAKIQLWKEINGYANKIEESYIIFFNVIVTIVGAVVSILEFKVLTIELQLALVIFLPIALAVVMAYLSYNFRWVAIARMYSSIIEKEINDELGEDLYVWNSRIIDDFMAKRNFTNTKLLPIVNILLFGFVWAFLNHTMFSFDFMLVFKIIYAVCITALFVACLCPFMCNEKIRKFDYELKDFKNF